MSLSIETAVRGIAEVMRDRVAPTLTDSYATEAVRLSITMLTIMANAADDAVALRVEEHGRIRALLGEGAALVGNPALAGSLAQAAASADPGLRISDLDAESDRLRRLLIALHIHVEARGDEVAQTMDQRIWHLLGDIEQSRAPRL